MFGGLHIEQCLLVPHGQLITGSGLRELLVSCLLSAIGAGAVVDVNQIKQYCVQVYCLGNVSKFPSAHCIEN